jgi:hypothetical protein
MERTFKEITTLAADLDLLASRASGSSPDPGAPPTCSREELVRFGVACRLGLFRTLHLLVKSRWEELVLDEKGRSPGGATDALDRLTRFEEGALARLLDRFRLGLGGGAAQEIHLLLERHGGLGSALGYDRDRLSALLDQMILSRVHYCGAASDELEAFVARQERELALLRDAGGEAQYQFWLKKSCWLAIRRELEDKLLLREEVRLRHYNVTMEWMALFGPTYLGLLEAQTRCHQLELRIALKRADPSLGDEELDRRVRESLEEELAAVERAKEEALQAAVLAAHPPEGEALFDEQLDRYLDEAKGLIREIWRLTHPDTLNEAFTEQQRAKLREFFERVVKIRRSEAHLDVRAIPVLKEILNKVKELYDVMGIDLQPESVIRGETLADQTAWLEAEIQRIELQIHELMAEIQAMSVDPDVREKMASMEGEEAQRATLLELQRLKEELEARSAALKADYGRLLAGGGTPVAC